MKKTFREKILFWGTKETKKHKYLKMPIFVIMAICLSIYYVYTSFLKNGKKIACTGVVIMFFFVNSSFGYQSQSNVTDVPFDVNGLQLAVEDATEEDVDLAEMIGDEDVWEFYEELAMLQDEDPDLYTLEDILAENREYIEKESADVPIDSEETGKEDNRQEESVEIPEFDSEDWRLLLVNKHHPIPEEYEFPLGTIKGSLKCDERILEDLLAMMQAAKDDGIDLNIASPYRDYNTQKYLFDKKMDKYLAKGLSYMDAYRVASTIVTAPNASEHQLGLAIDFNSSTYQSLNSGFAKTDTGKWLKKHCAEYGFILRYPEGKEYITGIIYEPWHFRYVGKEAAQFITQQGITLEEFWEDYLN